MVIQARIEQGVPIPPARSRGRSRWLREFWRGLKVGESFLVTDQRDLYIFRKLAQVDEWSYLTRIVREGTNKMGWRVWRLK